MTIDTGAGPETDQPSGETSLEEPLWRRVLRHSWTRTGIGLVVLAGIVGGLILIDRGGASSALGALDDQRPAVGEVAPQFALEEPGGAVRELSDYDGQPVWINFWATWCGPCRRELPDIQRLANRFEDQGLVVLEVNQEEPGETALDFWDELELELPILLDASGDVSEQYRLVGLPNNFFIDEDGVMRDFNLGFLTEEQMLEGLASIGLLPGMDAPDDGTNLTPVFVVGGVLIVIAAGGAVWFVRRRGSGQSAG